MEVPCPVGGVLDINFRHDHAVAEHSFLTVTRLNDGQLLLVHEAVRHSESLWRILLPFSQAAVAGPFAARNSTVTAMAMMEHFVRTAGFPNRPFSVIVLASFCQKTNGFVMIPILPE